MNVGVLEFLGPLHEEDYSQHASIASEAKACRNQTWLSEATQGQGFWQSLDTVHKSSGKARYGRISHLLHVAWPLPEIPQCHVLPDRSSSCTRRYVQSNVLRDSRQGHILIVSDSSTSSVSLLPDLLMLPLQYFSCHLGRGSCRHRCCRLCGRLAAPCACFVRNIESADWSDVLRYFNLAAEEVVGGVRPVHVPGCDRGRHSGGNVRRATTLSLCPTRLPLRPRHGLVMARSPGTHFC